MKGGINVLENKESKKESYFSDVIRFADKFQIDINDLTMSELAEFSNLGMQLIDTVKKLEELSSRAKRRNSEHPHPK